MTHEGAVTTLYCIEYLLLWHIQIQSHNHAHVRPVRPGPTQYRSMHISNEDKHRSIIAIVVHVREMNHNLVLYQILTTTIPSKSKHAAMQTYVLFVQGQHDTVPQDQRRVAIAIVVYFKTAAHEGEIMNSYCIEHQYHLQIQAHSSTNVRANHAEPTHHRFMIHSKNTNTDPASALHALYSDKQHMHA